jgi:hypothetical protein
VAKDWLFRLRGTDPAARTRADMLMNEARALSEAGRRAQAVTTGRQAVQLWRTIAHTARAEVLPSLAGAVLDHSNHLAAAGEHAGALRHAQEGFALAHEAVTASHGHPQMLAAAQANLALRLVESGRALEAVPVARAAADFDGELEDSLRAWITGVLARALAAAGEHTQALAVSERARSTVEQRADADPTPADLDRAVEEARALNNHANRLYQAGRWREAVEAAADSVARHRALTQRPVIAHLGQDASGEHLDRAAGRDRLARIAALARALRNQSVTLNGVRRWAESLAATEESVALEREISAADPVAGRPGLAAALSSYAIGLAAADRGDEARAAVAESVAIYRSMATGDRVAYLAPLVEAISNQAAITEADEAAVPLYEEVVRLRRELVDRNRAAYLPWLARTLNLLADRLDNLARPGPARAASDEAVGLARECLAANRAAFLPHFAFILRRHARRLDEAGESAAAIAAGMEAIEAGRESLVANRAAAARGLTAALEEQAERILAAPGAGEQQARDARALRSEAAEL